MQFVQFYGAFHCANAKNGGGSEHLFMIALSRFLFSVSYPSITQKNAAVSLPDFIQFRKMVLLK
jgi:hypothetical protein